MFLYVVVVADAWMECGLRMRFVVRGGCVQDGTCSEQTACGRCPQLVDYECAGCVAVLGACEWLICCGSEHSCTGSAGMAGVWGDYGVALNHEHPSHHSVVGCSHAGCTVLTAT